MRIGSKALELLPLMREAQAVHFYRDYPEHAQNPLKRFVTAMNEAGDALGGTEAREEVNEKKAFLGSGNIFRGSHW